MLKKQTPQTTFSSPREKLFPVLAFSPYIDACVCQYDLFQFHRRASFCEFKAYMLKQPAKGRLYLLNKMETH